MHTHTHIQITPEMLCMCNPSSTWICGIHWTAGPSISDILLIIAHTKAATPNKRIRMLRHICAHPRLIEHATNFPRKSTHTPRMLEFRSCVPGNSRQIKADQRKPDRRSIPIRSAVEFCTVPWVGGGRVHCMLTYANCEQLCVRSNSTSTRHRRVWRSVLHFDVFKCNYWVCTCVCITHVRMRWTHIG